MFPNFLPQTAVKLTESTSIAMVQGMESVAIATPLSQHPTLGAAHEVSIATTYVRQGSGIADKLSLSLFCQ
jgi:hypothetical protein